VDKAAVAPFVPRLLRALIMCFKDASWPVRDAACLACGRCVTAFPEQSREVLEVGAWLGDWRGGCQAEWWDVHM
jgi:ferredoxin